VLPTYEQAIAIAEKLTAAPVAFEAFWDGDTSGWYVALTAVIHDGQPDALARPDRTPTGYRDHFLMTLQGDSGDLRLFNGQVPPWPEAVRAREIGEQLAVHFGVPFYFACPNWPETDTPRWWRRHEASPCTRCGVPLLQEGERCPWRGRCYYCHLAEEREAQRGRT
jgi:hypothetical protein